MTRDCRDRTGGRIVQLLVGIFASLIFGVSWTSSAQTTPQQGAADSTYTLHVYTDLLQIPTIVLTRFHSNYRALTKQSFTLSLDGGPKFQPANVRLEGDDPITLAVLVDFTTDDNSMFASFAHAMSSLPPGVLSARDYISVYAYDCQLMRTTEDKPATPEQLRASMAMVMGEGRKRARNGAKKSCESNKHLFDVIGRISEDISDLPGRRVVLVISDGVDHQSKNDWLGVSRFAGSRSIAVFGMRPMGNASGYGRVSGSYYNEGWLSAEDADPFGKMCASTGGVVLDGADSKKMMAGQIGHLMTMLRDRYIIEFPRPANGSVGFYAFEVQMKDPTAIIRPAGVAFPPRERDAKAAEGTIPQDESKMPLVGSKHQDNQPK